MIQRVYFFICLTLLLSCTQKEENNTICPAVLCAAPSQNFKLKILDIKTNADLIFAPDRKLSDLKIHSFRFKKDIDFGVDSTDKTNRYIIFSTSVSDEFRITLGSLSSDTVKVETRFVDEDCCGRLEITSLTASLPLSFNTLPSNIIIIKK